MTNEANCCEKDLEEALMDPESRNEIINVLISAGLLAESPALHCDTPR